VPGKRRKKSRTDAPLDRHESSDDEAAGKAGNRVRCLDLFATGASRPLDSACQDTLILTHVDFVSVLFLDCGIPVREDARTAQSTV
jgi:hypothetical protein